MTSLVRVLRSPRLAVALIAGVAGWTAVASAAEPSARRALLGPAFYALVALLVAATAACAWERTRRAMGWRETLDRRPAKVLDCDVRGAVDVLASLGLRVEPGADAVLGVRRAGWLARLGSPVFHWALVALLAVVVAGQLTRHEGVVVLYPQRPVTDAAAAYQGTRSAGALFRGGYSGARLTLLEVTPRLDVAGVNRGQSPRVRVERAGAAPRELWIYPNHAYTDGALKVHAVDSGPAVHLAVRAPGQQPVALDVPLARDPSGAYVGGAEVERAAGTISLDVTQGKDKTVLVAASTGESATLGEGDTLEVADVTVAIDGLSTWATVDVVNDWSVPWIYACCAIALLAAAVALLYPFRAVLVEATEGGAAIRVMAARIDPTFARRVDQAFERRLNEKPD